MGPEALGIEDEHLMESPRSAHMRLREIRQSAKMHQALNSSP